MNKTTNVEIDKELLDKATSKVSKAIGSKASKRTTIAYIVKQYVETGD